MTAHRREIARTVKEQREAAEYLRSLGPAAGAWEWLWVADWVLEEVLLRLEGE